MITYRTTTAMIQKAAVSRFILKINYPKVGIFYMAVEHLFAVRRNVIKKFGYHHIESVKFETIQ